MRSTIGPGRPLAAKVSVTSISVLRGKLRVSARLSPERSRATA
jgi:hypothetical protein